MVDDALVALVARDLRRNLEARAPNERDVYGFCLWADDLNGSFLASMATEQWFDRWRRVEAYASAPDEEIFSLDGLRWNVGNWHAFPDDDFVTEETWAALAPLTAPLTDHTATEAEFEAAGAQWRGLAFAALGLTQPLDLLPCTEDAIAFVEWPDTSVEERLETMSRTVPASRLQEVLRGRRRGN